MENSIGQVFSPVIPLPSSVLVPRSRLVSSFFSRLSSLSNCRRMCTGTSSPPFCVDSRRRAVLVLALGVVGFAVSSSCLPCSWIEVSSTEGRFLLLRRSPGHGAAAEAEPLLFLSPRFNLSRGSLIRRPRVPHTPSRATLLKEAPKNLDFAPQSSAREKIQEFLHLFKFV